ncbi:MAG: hypothetical protein H0T62_05010, partial [Parachlamydiaceae bacterium]|nr:hypothetical protein [Parachlamydiaceae bacterium]
METVYVLDQVRQEYQKDSSKKAKRFNVPPTQFFNSLEISSTSQEIITNIGKEIYYSRDNILNFETFNQLETSKHDDYDDLGSQISFDRQDSEDQKLKKRNDWIQERKTQKKENSPTKKNEKENTISNKTKNFYSLPEIVVKKPHRIHPAKSSKLEHTTCSTKFESAPVLLIKLPKIQIPSDSEKEEIMRNGYLRGKSVELIEKRTARELALDLSESLLSFRDHFLTTRREKLINQIIKNDQNRELDPMKKNDQIKHVTVFDHREYVIIQDKDEEKKYNKALINFIESKSHKPKCTVAILSKLVLSIIEEEIFIQTGQKRLQKAEAWVAATTPRTKELIEIVQNLLLPVSPLYERTKNINLYQIEYMKAQSHKKTTLMAVMLFESTLGLTEIKVSPKKENQLISCGINLNTYLMLWNRIDSLCFKPSSEWGKFNEKKIKICNESIKNILRLTSDDSLNLISDYLKELNNTDFMIKKMYNEVIRSTHECMEHRNICCFEHQWKEAVDYPFNNWELLKPIDKISHKNLIDSLIKDGEVVPSKIIINGQVIFEKTSNSKLSPEKFLLKIFKVLYEQFGFKLPIYKVELSLEGQIGMLLISNENNNCGEYSEHMNHCIRFLKAGSKNSWNRAD